MTPISRFLPLRCVVNHHSFVNPSVRSFIHSSVRSSVRPFVRSFIHSFNHAIIHAFIVSFKYSLVFVLTDERDISRSCGVLRFMPVTRATCSYSSRASTYLFVRGSRRAREQRLGQLSLVPVKIGHSKAPAIISICILEGRKCFI